MTIIQDGNSVAMSSLSPATITVTPTNADAVSSEVLSSLTAVSLNACHADLSLQTTPIDNSGCDHNNEVACLADTQDLYGGSCQWDAVKTIEVQVRDHFQNNHHENGGYFLYVTLDDNAGTVLRGSVTAQAGGIYRVDYTPTHIGQWILSIQLASGVHTSGDGLTGVYYHNRYLSGSTVQTSVTNSEIDLYYDGTEIITATAKDYVSASFTGFIRAEAAEAYNFTSPRTTGCACTSTTSS